MNRRVTIDIYRILWGGATTNRRVTIDIYRILWGWGNHKQISNTQR